MSDFMTCIYVYVFMFGFSLL